MRPGVPASGWGGGDGVGDHPPRYKCTPNPYISSNHQVFDKYSCFFISYIFMLNGQAKSIGKPFL